MLQFWSFKSVLYIFSFLLLQHDTSLTAFEDAKKQRDETKDKIKFKNEDLEALRLDIEKHRKEALEAHKVEQVLPFAWGLWKWESKGLTLKIFVDLFFSCQLVHLILTIYWNSILLTGLCEPAGVTDSSRTICKAESYRAYVSYGIRKKPGFCFESNIACQRGKADRRYSWSIRGLGGYWW